MISVFNYCWVGFLLVFFSFTQETTKKSTIYILLEDKSLYTNTLQNDGLVSVYSTYNEILKYDSRKMKRDTVLKRIISSDKLTTVSIEREKELIWLDSANVAFMKQNGVPHPYSLVRNINSFYDKTYILESINEDYYLRTEVIWITKIE